MKLFTLLRGHSKKRLKPVMIDSLHKVENYRDALQSSDTKTFHYDVVEAAADAVVWRKSSSNKWTGYNDPGPKKIK